MRKFITLIQVLFVCVFIAGGIYTVKYFINKAQTEREIGYLQDLVDEGETAETPAPEDNGAETSTATEPPESREENGMLTRYAKLYAINSDMVGWIKIDGTKIDYPVVQSKESNSYYLHRNFEKETEYSGITYLDCQCDAKNVSDNLIVYGHNMRNGTMFHDLLDYDDEDFFDAHRTVAFDTLYFRGTYEVFAAFHTEVGASDEFKYYEFIDAASEEEYDGYVKKCIAMSEYDSGIVPKYGEKLLTLSTCSYNTKNERFVVVARLTGMK